MNISMIKLKGRGFLMGNLTVISLLILSLLSLSLCMNLIPGVVFQWETDLSEKSRSAIVLTLSVCIIAFLFAVISALDMGIDRFFLRKAQKKGASTKDFFFYFKPKEVLGMLSFSLRLFLIKFIMGTVCFLPAVLCGALVSSMISSSASLNVSVVLLIAFLCFILNGMYFYSRFSGTLFLAKYYYIKGEYLNFRQLVSSSQYTMKKELKNLRRLKLSFSGWFLLCLFILPSLYVFSYYRQSSAVIAAEFMKTDPLQNR